MRWPSYKWRGAKKPLNFGETLYRVWKAAARSVSAKSWAAIYAFRFDARDKFERLCFIGDSKIRTSAVWRVNFEIVQLKGVNSAVLIARNN